MLKCLLDMYNPCQNNLSCTKGSHIWTLNSAEPKLSNTHIGLEKRAELQLDHEI